MKHEQCPICYDFLVVKDITPCYVCGGWDGAVESFESDKEFYGFMLDSGQAIDLCIGCWIEEIGSLQGNLADELKLPKSGGIATGINSSCGLYNPLESTVIQQGKYCNNCDKTLNLLKVISEIRNAT